MFAQTYHKKKANKPMSSNSTPAAGAAPPQNQVLNYYREWANRTPLVARSTLLVLSVMWLLSWFLPLDAEQLGNVPYFTIFYYELYRIIVSPLVGNDFISLVVTFFFYPQLAASFEYSIGSLSLLSLIVTMTVLNNLLFILLCFVFYFFGTVGALFWSNSGFWAVIFALLAIDCLKVALHYTLTQSLSIISSYTHSLTHSLTH
jgi:hypothetical protein